MHIVLINQYFPPDVAPTGVVLERVAREIVALGHPVTVICGAGGYGGGAHLAESQRWSRHDIKVVRVAATRFGRLKAIGKLADYVSFYVLVSLQLMRIGKPGLVITLTTPPYLSLLGRLGAFLRGANHGHWVMDLYPDVLQAHGAFQKPLRGHRLMRLLARIGWGGSRNQGVLTLGPDMHERTCKYLRPGVRRKWVPLWGTAEGSVAPSTEEVERLRRERGWEPHQLVLMYSGNMGLGHRFGEFLEAARNAGPSVRFVFFGEGKRKTEIESFRKIHPGKVELHGYVGPGDLPIHLRSADVHLVSLEPSWDGTMVPSKLQGIFAAGRPVIFVGSRTSSTGQWIEESGAGWVIEPGEAGGLERAVRGAADPDERARRGRRAVEYARVHFDADTNARAAARFLLGLEE